jgi:hypothetical protein
MVRLTAAADYKNIRVATPMVGETTVYGSSIRSAKWWEEVIKRTGGALNTAVIEKDF